MKAINSLVKSASAFIGTSMLAASVFTLVGTANAATFACPTSPNNIADNVTGTSACEISDNANQDFLNTNPMTVNGEAFFNNTDWVFGGKIGENTGYIGTGSGQSGIWGISSAILSSWDDVMLIFKSGQGTTLVGYLLTDGVISGTWTSPFEEPPFNFPGNGPKDVSHISVYYRGQNTPPIDVPEPSLMLGLAFAGAGLVASRRRKSVANS